MKPAKLHPKDSDGKHKQASNVPVVIDASKMKRLKRNRDSKN